MRRREFTPNDTRGVIRLLSLRYAGTARGRNRILLATVILCIVVLTMVFGITRGKIRAEELNAIQFKEAVEKSSRTAILPIGVIEKHGPHMPLGTDVYTARELALLASEEEYTVVFPWYYFSQINEAKHQPGTIAYSPELNAPAFYAGGNYFDAMENVAEWLYDLGYPDIEAPELPWHYDIPESENDSGDVPES